MEKENATLTSHAGLVFPLAYFPGNCCIIEVFVKVKQSVKLLNNPGHAWRLFVA